MTSSSEIHVQEVLNNLTNSIKRDGIEKLDIEQSFSAVIAQHNAQHADEQAVQTAQAVQAVQAQVQAQADAQAQAPPPAQQHHTQEQHDQHQVNQVELERIAQEHQQAQAEAKTEHGQAQETVPTNNPDQKPADENTIIHVNALDAGNSSTLATVPITPTSPAPPAAKPVHGTEEWHKMRRDNHKEVERRRRETINAGITDLAQVIPNPDKNKGAILRQAVKYIKEIQETHQKTLAAAEALPSINFEKERALVEKNVAQTQLQGLITEHDQLKREYEALREKVETLEEESKKRQRTDE